MAINATNYDGTKDYKIAETEDLPYKQTSTFSLVTNSGREVNHTTEYEYFHYFKVGELIFWVLMWKGNITEFGEQAYISSPLFTTHPSENPMYYPATISECNCIGLSDSTIQEDVTCRLTDNHIGFGIGPGNVNIGYWCNKTGAYLRLSGWYRCTK